LTVFCINLFVNLKEGATKTQINDTNFSLRLHYFGGAGNDRDAETIPPEPA
jgi:hypothetical protein